MTRVKPDHLLICNTSDGLIAQVNGVIVQLWFARQMGLTPIVYLHGRSTMFGGHNPYFDAEQGPNVWDYYFKPIGPSGAELEALVAEGRVATLSTASELERLFRWDRSNFFMNPFGYYRSVENKADGPYPSEWWNAQRDVARAFIKDDTITFGTSVMAQVDAFEAANFGHHTLGLQLRGSDKFDFGVGPNLSRKIEPQEYYPYIDRYLEEHPDCDKIFVATDQRQWLKVLEADYPDHVISYSEMSLSDSDENNFNKTDAKAARGAEVMADMLLLTRCNHLFKCHAAVGEMALVMNPDLTFLDLNYAGADYEAKRRVPGLIAGPLVAGLTALWGALAQRGFALSTVVSVEGDDVQVDPKSPRSLNTKPSIDQKAPRSPLASRRFVSDLFDWALRALASVCFSYSKKPK